MLRRKKIPNTSDEFQREVSEIRLKLENLKVDDVGFKQRKALLEIRLNAINGELELMARGLK